ncbi:MAG: 1-hydroxycarotenoid 3,4-desaturase CrtD [Leadbetterella sp.]
MRKNVAIIGSGIGGLSLAVRLAVKGYKVDVFEANSYPGGKLTQIESSGYRFDAGPSLFTFPHLLDELFTISGKNPKDYLDYYKLDEICRYFWDDGEFLTAPSDLKAFDLEVEKRFKEKPGSILSYLDDSAFKFEILDSLFLKDSLSKWRTWVSKSAFRGYVNLAKLGIFKTLHEHNSAYFSHPRIIQLFDRYATYNGSDPYKTPGTMGIIPHLEYNDGAYFPVGGMHSISQGIYKLAIDLGVRFYFDSKVSKINVVNKKAHSLIIQDTESQSYDYICSNMDVTPTYRTLLLDQIQPTKILNQEKSGSGLIFYWGIKKTFSQLGLHNILFSNDYKEEFNHQFKKKTIYNDPTVYINITSKHNSLDAPLGCENWFVLINAPNNSGQDWELEIRNTRRNVINKVSSVLGEDIETLIESEQVLDPLKIESKTSSSQGALYGNSSNNKFAAFLRHPNQSPRIENLFFVGGSVHPGGGIPLAVSSAKITSSYFTDI